MLCFIECIERQFHYYSDTKAKPHLVEMEFASIAEFFEEFIKDFFKDEDKLTISQPVSKGKGGDQLSGV